MSNNNKTLLQTTLLECRKSFFYAFLFSFFINIAMLAMPIYSLQVLDRVLSSFSIQTLIFISIIVAVMLIFWAIMQILRNFIFTQIGNYVEKKLEAILVDKTIDNSVYNHEIGSSYVRDLSNIKSFLTNPALASLFDAPFAIIYFIVIFFIHPLNGFITVTGAIILLIMAFVNEKLANKNLKKSGDEQTEFFSKIGSLSGSSEAMIAMGMKQNVINKLFNTRIELRKHIYKAGSTACLVANITKVLRFFIQIATMATGAVLVMNNKMSAGGIIATSILAGKALAPFDAIVNIWQQFFNCKKSYNRLNNIIDEVVIESEKTELPEPLAILKLEKISYKVKGSDKFILNNIDFMVNPGEVIAILGASGSGKTTLARLIAGIITPSLGKVTIDNSKLENFNREFLGKYIGYLPQQVEFIHASIKENIARMEPNIDDAKVILAAQNAGSHEIIQNFDKGYDTIIENLGKNLSAGQKQRIALARCFYGNTKIMILDEPNSNLDSDGEKALVNALNIAKQNKISSLIISHRTAILDAVDKIAVMHEGKMELFDQRDKVLKKLEIMKENAATE
jgi:PrtD family type I secretion system ABC transporter